MIELKKKQISFRFLYPVSYPGTESNFLILDPGLDYKGLRYFPYLFFMYNISKNKETKNNKETMNNSFV
jgi:hypothetical protein